MSRRENKISLKWMPINTTKMPNLFFLGNGKMAPSFEVQCSHFTTRGGQCRQIPSSRTSFPMLVRLLSGWVALNSTPSGEHGLESTLLAGPKP